MDVTLEQQLRRDAIDFLESEHLNNVAKIELERRLNARAERAAKLEAALAEAEARLRHYMAVAKTKESPECGSGKESIVR